MLEIRNVTKIYHSKSGNSVRALDDVSITFPETGMVFILGKSGSGKSTLLNVIGGLDGCDAGEFVIKGKSSKQFAASDFDAYRNTFIGFIFQEYNILDDFTVGANIGLALELQGKKADGAEISRILAEVDLADYAKRKPNELSGGQKQRVAIARALVKDPEIIMADEPTGALDSNTGKQIFDTLKELSRKKLVIVVSHDRDFAERYGDRIIEMMDGKVYSDVTRHAVSAEAVSDGILKMNDNLLRIEKGYQLTARDVEMINAYLRTREHDVLLSSDRRLNDGVRAAAGIAEDNTSSVFDTTDEERDVKKKDYSCERTKFIRSRLPMKNAFRMGGSSLGHKKFRLVVTILLSLIAFSLFGFADTMAAYNKYRTAVQSIRDSNIRYAAYTLGVREDYVYPDGESYYYYSTTGLNADDVEYLKEKLGSDFIPVFSGSPDNMSSISLSSMLQTSQYISGAYAGVLYGFVAPSAEQISDFGYVVTGSLPTQKDEIAISRLVYEQIRANGFVNDKFSESVNAGELTMQVDGGKNSIIGKHLSLNVNGLRMDYKITAVIDTAFDYDRYASFIPDTTGQQQGGDDNSLADMILQMELQNAIRYGFHNLAFLSHDGLETMEESVPVYSYDYIGTSMNWSVSLRGSDGEGNDFEAMWYNYVAQSSALADLDVTWLDGNERTKLGEKEMVVSDTLLNQLQISIDLREDTLAHVKAACGDYWKDEYRDYWLGESLAMAVVYEEIDRCYDLYKTEVAQLVGVDESDEEMLKRIWYEQYDWILMEIDQTQMRTRSELVLAKAAPIVREILGAELIGQMRLDALTSETVYVNILETLMQNEIMSWEMVNFSCRLYAYGEVYTRGAELYDSEAFRTAFLERYGYQNVWDEFDDEQKRELAAQMYESYVLNETQGVGNSFGGKTYSDFEAPAQARFYALSDRSIEDILSRFYLRISTWWNETEETDYKDFRIVGLYNARQTDLVVSDTLYTMHEDYCTEQNMAKHHRHPHDAGHYAYALAVMPSDEASIMKMVELSYDETGGLKFSLQNQVMDTLGNFNDFIEMGAKVFLYIGIGFAVFSALMLMNFISISISYKRREIGILRAVGARSSDVFKIFFCEAFLIALINYVLSIATTVAAVTFFNTYVRKEGVTVTLLNFGVRQVLLMLVISFLVAAIASFLPVWNIARRKPVDAIKNK